MNENQKDYVVVENINGQKHDFIVLDKNLYSMSKKVNSMLGTTVSQIIHLQTLCYYHPIKIKVPQFRNDACDLLTKLNQLSVSKKLPSRPNDQKGKAYINKDGIMILCDWTRKPYIGDPIVNPSQSRTLTPEHARFMNNRLLANYKCKLVGAALAEWIVPDITRDEAIAAITPLVYKYKVSFNLNRDIRSIIEGHDKLATTVMCREVAERLCEGSVYIDSSNTMRFKVIADIDQQYSDPNKVEIEISNPRKNG